MKENSPRSTRLRFWRNPPGTSEECETSNLIRDLESSKGLSLTPLQKKVILMKSVGKGTRDYCREYRNHSRGSAGQH